MEIIGDIETTEICQKKKIRSKKKELENIPQSLWQSTGLLSHVKVHKSTVTGAVEFPPEHVKL